MRLRLKYWRTLAQVLIALVKKRSPQLGDRVASIAHRYARKLEFLLDNPHMVRNRQWDRAMVEFRERLRNADRGRGKHKQRTISDEALLELHSILKQTIHAVRAHEKAGRPDRSAEYVIRVFGELSPFGTAEQRVERIQKLSVGNLDDRWLALIEGAARYVGLPVPSDRRLTAKSPNRAQMLASCRKDPPGAASLNILGGICGVSSRAIQKRLSGKVRAPKSSLPRTR